MLAGGAGGIVCGGGAVGAHTILYCIQYYIYIIICNIICNIIYIYYIILYYIRNIICNIGRGAGGRVCGGSSQNIILCTIYYIYIYIYIFMSLYIILYQT